MILDVTGSIPVDTRGHRHLVGQNRTDRTERLNGATASHVTLMGLTPDDTNVEDLDADTLHGMSTRVVSTIFDCATCGASPSFSAVKHPDGPHGIGLRSHTACTLPDGATTVTQFDVASGKIVTGALLTRLFDDIDVWPTINHTAGVIAHAQAVAARNGLYLHPGDGYAGGLFRLGSPHFPDPEGGRYQIIACPADDDPTAPGMPILGPAATMIAETGWDFSWVYVMDHGDFLARCTEVGLDPDDPDAVGDVQVVDFPNGLYQVVNHSTRLDFGTQTLPTHQDPEASDEWREPDAVLLADIAMVFPTSMRKHRAAMNSTQETS